jgi:2-polyprenyl-6-methoxyphenol hydroxylase-like FAD-dependent oxidoreductase
VQLGRAFARFTAATQTVTVHGGDGRSIETEALVGADGLRSAVRAHLLPIDALLARTPPERLLWNDIFDVKPLPRFAFGRVLLLGDAVHATTPNLGQGAGQAVEDAPALATGLARFPGDAPAAFAAFDAQRRPRTTRIVEQSRRLGQAAQLEYPWLTVLRDAAMRRVPARFTQRQLAFLYHGHPA